MTTDASPATQLCKACGLCCTGHLFVWAKLRPAELDPAEALGMHVYRDDPTQRGFSQPCPLWQGVCTIYTSPYYPRSCRAYTCDLFDQVLRENTTLPDALLLIEQAKEMIQGLEPYLPIMETVNFRERLVARLEGEDTRQDAPEFRRKAEALLLFYKKIFGVKDLLETSGEM